MTSRLPVRVLLAPPFVGKVNRLHKKYRHVWSDVQPLIDLLKRGETPGDQMHGVGYTVYKARVRNSDLQRGKSGGYRVIYYIRTADLVVLLTIYPKTEREDISAEEIRRIIESYTPPTG